MDGKKYEWTGKKNEGAKKLLFHHNLSLVPCSSDDVYLCPFMITPNDFVAPRLEFCKDVGALEVSQLLLHVDITSGH